MFLRRLIFLLVAATFVPVIVVAQDISHPPHDMKPFGRPFRAPAITYRVVATVFPDSSLVVGSVEIDYKNNTSDSLTEICLNTGPTGLQPGDSLPLYGKGSATCGQYSGEDSQTDLCCIDSILYQAARLTVLPVMIDSESIRIGLPSPMPPGDRETLLIAFHLTYAQPDDTITAQNWYMLGRWFPTVAVHRDGIWYTAGSVPRFDVDGQPSQFTVTIDIDSSYTIIAPGELINEKEHYGTFERSKGDTVFVGVLSHLFAYAKDRPYRPQFRNGVKQYVFRLADGNNFPIVITRAAMLDRSYDDDLPVNVWYNLNLKDIWQRRVAKEARESLSRLKRKLGTYPFPSMTVFPVSGPEQSHYRETVTIPAAIENTDELLVALENQLARSWFTDVYPPHGGFGSDFDEGLAYYVTLTDLIAAFGAKSYSMIEDYESYVYDLQGRSQWDAAHLESMFKSVPARLYMLEHLIGDSVIWSAIRDYTDTFRFDLPRPDDFERIVEARAAQDVSWFFREWNRPGATLDYYFDKIKFGESNGGTRVEGNIGNLGNVYMPVELGFITGKGDTVFVDIARDDFKRENRSAAFNIDLPLSAKAAVIDPRHYLLDSNRDNNVAYPHGKSYPYRQPANLFPALRQ